MISVGPVQLVEVQPNSRYPVAMKANEDAFLLIREESTGKVVK